MQFVLLFSIRRATLDCCRPVASEHRERATRTERAALNDEAVRESVQGNPGGEPLG
jgi:hypothetical protein